MKKYITYLLATALVGSAFVSCTERLQEGEMRISTHKVHFAASDMETRTGLSIDGTTVTPDWNKTALESIHLFEIDANEAVAYGETIAITTSEDNATAHFEADFPTDMSIIVDPSDPEEDSGAKGASNGDTKGTRVSPYRYAAIIAQKPDKNNLTFVVPSEQHPDAETLKDPDADFLIGYSRKAYDTEHFFDEPVVDLYFDRVAALGRLAISNFAEGEKVQSVTINAQNGLTGSASYADIDFENGSVSFVREEGPGAITLVYDGGMDIPADGPFYAYFVAIPGSATLTSVEVVTNQYHYTKTIEGGKELTFSEKAFKSMNLDLSTATREEVAPSGLTWYKASVLEDGIDYIIVSNGYALKNNGSKAVVAAQTVEIVDGTISLEETDGLIWTANANSEFTEYGTHTLSNGSEHLWRHSDNGTFTLEANNEAITKYMVWNYDGEYLWNISIYTGSGSAQISDYYAYYSSGWKISTTKTAATLFTSRAPQELAFTPAASAEYDLATSEWIVAVPTLSGVQTSVTYALSEDSNPAVATVDADGTVHPLSKGAVTIVATAAGNDQYQAASASYTLRVVDSSVTTNTYIKVTSTSDLEVGAKYLRLHTVCRTLGLHRYVQAADNFVAVYKNQTPSFIAFDGIALAVYPVIVRLLGRKIRDCNLTVSGCAVFVQHIQKRILQLWGCIGITAGQFRQRARLFASCLVAWISAFTTVTHRVAHPINLAGIISGFYPVKLQISQPVFGCLTLEPELMPFTVCGYIVRLAIVRVGHNDSTRQHFQPHPTSVVGVRAAIAFRPVMSIVVRLINHKIRVVVVGCSFQMSPATGARLDAILLFLVSPEVS